MNSNQNVINQKKYKDKVEIAYRYANNLRPIGFEPIPKV